MTILFEELKEKLMRFDEIILLELLNISSEDLVNRFEDIIDERYDDLLKEIEE